MSMLTMSLSLSLSLALALSLAMPVRVRMRMPVAVAVKKPICVCRSCRRRLLPNGTTWNEHSRSGAGGTHAHSRPCNHGTVLHDSPHRPR
jgi:hypothetical protein